MPEFPLDMKFLSSAKITAEEILKRYPPLMENVLLILHEIQNNCPQHYLSKKDLVRVANYLNTSYASIYGVVTYYTLFSIRPRGRHIIRICRSPVCDMIGSDEILAEIRRLLQIDLGETTFDGRFTLEASECIGQCDQAPSISIDDTIFGNLTPSRLKPILERFMK